MTSHMGGLTTVRPLALPLPLARFAGGSPSEATSSLSSGLVVPEVVAMLALIFAALGALGAVGIV